MTDLQYSILTRTHNDTYFSTDKIKKKKFILLFIIFDRHE